MAELVSFYNCDYICMYPYITEIMKDPGNKDLEDLTFQKDFLQILQIESMEQTDTNPRIEQLFSFCITNPEIPVILTELVKALSIQEEVDRYPYSDIMNPLILPFCCLFSFDFLYLFHPCVCDLIQSNKITENHLITLREAISSFKRN